MNITPEDNIETDDDSNEWQELQHEWQSYQPDIVKIKKKIAWVTWRMIAILVIDVLLLIAFIPFLMFETMQESVSLAEKIWHFGMFPLFVYGVYWDFKLRLPLFKLESESTKDILAFYLKRVKAGIKLGELGYQFSLLLEVLFIVWLGANWYFDLGEERLKEIGFIVFGICWIGLFVGIMLWYKQKKEKELIRLTELWKEFLE
jgi:hypothetical protein